MSKARIMDHAVTFAGIIALTAGTVALATEDPDTVVENEVDRVELLEEFAPDENGPVDLAQERTLDLMFMIWILKNPSNDFAR